MEALKAVYALAFRQLFRSRRTVFMVLLSIAPIAMSALGAAAVLLHLGEGAPTGFSFVAELMGLMYLQFLLLALTLFYATALIGDEIDDRTITYLLVRPVPRAVIYLGKFLACVTVTMLLIIPSAALSFAVLTSVDPLSETSAHAGILGRDIGILFLGALAYCGVFGFFGAWFRRPLLAGILFSLVWESFITYIPGYIHRFTVMHYLQSLLPHPSGQRGILQIFQQTTSAPISVLTLLLIAGGSLALAAWVVARREYVLEA